MKTARMPQLNSWSVISYTPDMLDEKYLSSERIRRTGLASVMPLNMPLRAAGKDHAVTGDLL